MKYNYVIFSTPNDYYKSIYTDVINMDNVLYINGRLDTKSKVLTLLCRLHTSPKTNNILPLPFKGIWNRWVFRGRFDNDNPICFIFFEDYFWFGERFVKYLRKKYKGCKIVFYYQDMVERTKRCKNPDEIRKLVDFMISYDKGQAEKYQMALFQDVYSKTDIEEDNTLEERDVFFCGIVKDRLNKILSVYDRCVELGLTTRFYLVGVKEEDRVIKDGLIYGDKLPYRRYLQLMQKSKAILEILSGNSKGYTLRVGEAVCYNKKLITNNLSIKEEKIYSKDNICAFDSVEEITKEFIEGQVNFGEKAREDISPKALLEFIEKNLD